MKISELFEGNEPAKEQIWEVELPIAEDDDGVAPATFAAKFSKRFKVQHKMTRANGPSGGWPEFVFWGPRVNMEKLMKAYHKGAGLSKEEQLEDLKKSRRKYTVES